MLHRTDRSSHEETSVKYKGWLSQGAVISLRKLKGGDGWHWRFGKNEICSSGMLCSRVPCLPTDLEPFRGRGCYCCTGKRNTHDRYAVAILEEDTCCSVGHLPREISKECFYFLKMGGAIKAEITGPSRRSDLPQGGLEIPCILILEHKEDFMIKKVKQLLKSRGFSEPVTDEKKTTGTVTEESSQMSRKRKAEEEQKKAAVVDKNRQRKLSGVRKKPQLHIGLCIPVNTTIFLVCYDRIILLSNCHEKFDYKHNIEIGGLQVIVKSM